MKRFIAVLLSVASIFCCISCTRSAAPDYGQLISSDDYTSVEPASTGGNVGSITEATAEPATAATTAFDVPEISPDPIGNNTEATQPPELSTNKPSETLEAEPSSTPKETPEATGALPSAAPTATPAVETSAPTDAPQPQGEISFNESASLPIPSMNEDVPYGQPLCFGGTVSSRSPILSVSAVIYSGSNAVITQSVSFSEAQNMTSVELVDRTFPAEGNQSLTAKVRFETLSVGTYTIKLFATAVGTSSTLLKSSQFRVVRNEWNQLISNNLRNNYAYALSFFGSRDEFLFRYKWDNGRQITVEPSWLNSHFTSVTSPAGKTWYVHKKAAPFYNEAINYMSSTYVHVGGTYDSGVIRLWDLVASYDGILNTRFVSDRTFVSHHAFGTAIDLNASMDANRNVLSNRNLIRDEVQNHLVYNGIKERNGIKYYDFTYNGSHSSTHRNVPTTIINYLLYELAFYRAGFGWGYYYVHACDGMHFTVSEMPASIHDTSSRSLRKVFQYI